ncbi:IS6 family transposase [Streptomyces sp. NPDC057910]|uniref:IS6 family transposase n=1 Tax=Streptomyces sp. NPDC057910 TaxID=3346278 RepID=UPI0036E488FF
MSDGVASYKNHRYPVEVISHCVWLYFRFPLGYREVEELMLERGVIVSYETIRRWCGKFGQTYAGALRRRRPRPRPGDKGHLDEVFIRIQGVQKYLWRAVDTDGHVLDILVQNRRDKAAAVMPSVEHRSPKGLNNRAENSHQPTRQRERAMKGFRTVAGAQRFLSAFTGISPHFRPHRHLMTAGHHRFDMRIRFTLRNHITGTTGLPATA